MAGTITNQARIEPNELSFEYGTITFSTTDASGDVTILDSDLEAPDFIIGEPVTAGCATNEEMLSLGAYSAGVQTIQRDGETTLTSAGVFNYMLIWKDK